VSSRSASGSPQAGHRITLARLRKVKTRLPQRLQSINAIHEALRIAGTCGFRPSGVVEELTAPPSPAKCDATTVTLLEHRERRRPMPDSTGVSVCATGPARELTVH
jgi:hypothetical protein